MNRSTPIVLALTLLAGCLDTRETPPPTHAGYVAVANSDRVVRIDFDAWAATDELDGFATPHGAVITPDGEELYVASFERDDLTVVKIASGARRSIPLGSTTHHLKTSADGQVVYVTLGSEGAVAFVARHSDEVLARIPTGRAPFDLAISPDGAAIYVADTGSDDVARVDTRSRTLSGTVGVGAGPTHVVVSADGATVYVTSAVAGTVSEIDAESLEVRRNFDVGADAHGLALSPDGARLLVSGWPRRLVEIDRSTGEARDIKVPSDDTHGLVFSPDGALLLVCDIVENRMLALDPTTYGLLRTLALPPSPHQLSFTGW